MFAVNLLCCSEVNYNSATWKVPNFEKKKDIQMLSDDLNLFAFQTVIRCALIDAVQF